MAICESCGRDETSVTKVQRMYLADRTGGASTTAEEPHELHPAERPTAGDIELWCASCCATFPHVTIDAS